MLPNQKSLTDILRRPTSNNINESAKYTANTGVVLINTANANLDGTGTTTTLITAGGSGTLIKTIRVKALGDTTEGMVRIFVYNSASTAYYLIGEIPIPPSKKSGTYPAFEIAYDLNFSLETTYYSLKVSTQNSESFAVIAEGLDWAY